MNIKINGKTKIEIPEADQLNVGQYCDLMQLESVSMVDYLAYFTGYSKEQILNSNILNKDLSTISSVIGAIKPFSYFSTISKLPEHISINGKLYDYNKLNELTGSVGARILLSQFVKNKEIRQLDPIIYLLAIITSGTFDVEATKRRFDELQKENYIDCFKIASFFFRKLISQSSKGLSYSNKLKMKLMTLIQGFGKRLV